MGVREESRARTTAAILAAARRAVAEEGAGSLSMRAVAREVGMVSSAVYRYFPSRDALITAMVLESYTRLAAVLDGVDGVDRGPAPAPAERWRAVAGTMRTWAREFPHEFQLIYGTPIPGYAAPPETIPAAAAVARPFLEAGARHEVSGFADPVLTAPLGMIVEAVTGVVPSGVAAVLAELAALIGFVSLELSGHLVGLADPADHLYAALLDRQVGTLGLAG